MAGNATLDEIVRLLRPGGRLFIQTDVFARAAALLRELTDDGRLVNTDPGGGLIGASPLGSRSNRERVCEESGRPVLRLMFEKPREHG